MGVHITRKNVTLLIRSHVASLADPEELDVRWLPSCSYSATYGVRCFFQASHSPRCEAGQLRTWTWSRMFDDILHRLRAEYALQTPTHVAAYSLPRRQVPNWYPKVKCAQIAAMFNGDVTALSYE